MTSKINDENRVRANYVSATKIPFTFITPAEIEGVKSQIWKRQNATESEQLFIAGCALMLITGQGPNSDLICSWTKQNGKYIDLNNNVYVTEFYVPENAAKKSDLNVFRPVDQSLELPIPHFIADTIASVDKFKGRESVGISELLPPSLPLVWNKLYTMLPGNLVSGRDGQSFFQLWLATEISECSDKDIAHGVCQFSGFSSNHHLYYPTIKKSIVHQAWCKAMENIFGVGVNRGNVPQGYVGSYVYIDDEYLKIWLDNHYARFPVSHDWRRFNKEQLIEYYNELVIEGWLGLSTNFSLRHCGSKLIRSLFKSKSNKLTRVLDKQVTKDHPERYLPMTDVTEHCIRCIIDVATTLKKKFSIKIDAYQLNIIDVDKNIVGPLDVKHINAALFGGVDVPVNAIRHYVASQMRELNIGVHAHTMLGHRPDKVHLPNPDILYSPASGELEEAILAIQTESVGLKIRKAKARCSPDHKTMLLNCYKSGKYDEALAHLWALTKPKFILDAISIHGAEINRSGEFNSLFCNREFVDFITDEQLALYRGIFNSDLKAIAKRACAFINTQRFSRCMINESFNKHIEYYSSRSNYLSLDCINSFLQPLPSLDIDFKSTYKTASSIQIKVVSTERLKRLIDTLSQPHKIPVEILRNHLIDSFGVDEFEGDDVGLLLDIIQLRSDTAELAIYRYMYKKMLARINAGKRNIASNTWITEFSKVYSRILRQFKNIAAVSSLSREDVANFRDELINSIKSSLGSETVDSMMYVINGIFSLIGEEPVNFFTQESMDSTPMPKSVIWPHQYEGLLNQLSKQPSKQAIIDCAAAVLMYKAGIRPCELSLCEISGVIRVASKYKKRTKSVAGNRVIRCQLSLTAAEKNILDQFCKLSSEFCYEAERTSLFDGANIALIGGILKLLTNNKDACAYDLRRSFANFYYLLITRVDIPVVRVFFNTDNVVVTLKDLKDLWCIKGYGEEAILKALSMTMGHKDVSMTMDRYICTLALMRLYHGAKESTLKGRQIAALLDLPNSTYSSRKKFNASGFEFGSHLVKGLTSDNHYPKFDLPSCASTHQVNPLISKALTWHAALHHEDKSSYAFVKEGKALFGLTEKDLKTKLTHQMTNDIVKYLSEEGGNVWCEIYQEWICNLNTRTGFVEPLDSAGFIKVRDRFHLEYRFSSGKYVKRGHTMSMNKHISAAILVMSSKCSV